MKHKRHSLLQQCAHALRSVHAGIGSFQWKKKFLFFPKSIPVFFLVSGVLLFLCVALAGRPVDSLHIERAQGLGLRSLLPLGHSFTTRYIHSVERTPVEDVYYGMDGRICQWRTRTRSHNAGLPATAPVPGRFVSEDPWLVLEGGRLSWDALYLRVGNAQFGQNELDLQATSTLLLYKMFPDERVRLSTARLPLYMFLATLKRTERTMTVIPCCAVKDVSTNSFM